MNAASSSMAWTRTAATLLVVAAAGCGEKGADPPVAERLRLPHGWNTVTSAPVFSPDGKRFAVLAQQITREKISDPNVFVWSRTDGKRRRVALKDAADETLALSNRDVITTELSRPMLVRTAPNGTKTSATLPGSEFDLVSSVYVPTGDPAAYVVKTDIRDRGVIYRIPLEAGDSSVVGRTTGAGPRIEVGVNAAERRIAMMIASRGVHALVQPKSGDSRVLHFTPKSSGGKFATREPPVVRDIALTRDGRTLAVGIDEQPPQVWDLPRHRPLGPVRVSSGIGYVALSPSGRYLAVIDEKNAVRIWDVQARQPAASLRPRLLPRSQWIYGLAWSERSELAAATQGGMNATPMLVIWKLDDFE
jgi:WD40 repeat protein